MKALAPWLLAGLVLGRAVPARADDADPWFGRDKALHFGVSFGLAGGAYTLAAPWLKPPRWRALTGFSVAFAAGLAKEAWDATGHGDASVRDLTWDLVGSLSGTLLAWGVDRALGRRRARRHPVTLGFAF
jgi:putative lipoprotein